MATITISYNGRSSKARKAINELLSTGLFKEEHKPNRLTMAAIEEAKAGKYAGVVDTSSFEAMLRSME